MRAGPSCTTPWLAPICPTSGTCAPRCSGLLRRTNWCLASSILLPPRSSVPRRKKKRPRLVRPLGQSIPPDPPPRCTLTSSRFRVIWVFLTNTCQHGSPSKKRELRGVVNPSPIIAVCSVTTGHRTGRPPSLTPVATLI